MKHVAAIALLVAVTAVVVALEYEMAMWLGVRLLLIAASGMILITVALSRAPVGYDSHDEVHICWTSRPAVKFPQHRLSQLIRVQL
jgi:hypothetical protein